MIFNKICITNHFKIGTWLFILLHFVYVLSFCVVPRVYDMCIMVWGQFAEIDSLP